MAARIMRCFSPKQLAELMSSFATRRQSLSPPAFREAPRALTCNSSASLLVASSGGAAAAPPPPISWAESMWLFGICFKS